MIGAHGSDPRSAQETEVVGLVWHLAPLFSHPRPQPSPYSRPQSRVPMHGAPLDAHAFPVGGPCCAQMDRRDRLEERVPTPTDLHSFCSSFITFVTR